MLVRIVCSACSTSLRVETDRAKSTLRRTPAGAGRTAYGFGDHVVDQRAFAMRFARLSGWQFTTTPIGKSTITMDCPAHLPDAEIFGLEGDA